MVKTFNGTMLIRSPCSGKEYSSRKVVLGYSLQALRQAGPQDPGCCPSGLDLVYNSKKTDIKIERRKRRRKI